LTASGFTQKYQGNERLLSATNAGKARSSTLERAVWTVAKSRFNIAYKL